MLALPRIATRGAARAFASAAFLRVGDGEQTADHVALMLAEIRVPAVEDEERAILIAGVPRLMLDRVVESEGLALAPLARLAADPKGAAGRHDQRQVKIGRASCRGRVETW